MSYSCFRNRRWIGMAIFFSMSIFTNGSSKNVSVHWTTGQRNLLKLTEQNKETSNTLSLELSLKNDTLEKYYAFSLLSFTVI